MIDYCRSTISLASANADDRPNDQSSIINNQCLQTQCLNRASVNAGPAIDAGIRIHGGLAVHHTDGIARTLIHARLTSRAFRLIYFSRHLYPFQNREPMNLLRKYGIITHHRAITTEKSAKFTPTRRRCQSVRSRRRKVGPGAPGCHAQSPLATAFSCSFQRARRPSASSHQTSRVLPVPPSSDAEPLRRWAERSTTAMPRTNSFSSCCAVQSRTLPKSPPASVASR